MGHPCGAFVINMIVHNSLTQNRNMLKFWIYTSYPLRGHKILIDAIEKFDA